jgi:hypothetical protein
METSKHPEPDEGWRQAGVTGEEWARLQSLLELVRREHHRTELDPERREQIRERVMERLERQEARQRRRRMLVARASALLLVGLAFLVWWWSSEPAPAFGERRPGARA